jgi:NADP-dependent 3-hydroxy acid dehydrogenase YdfG
VSRALAERGAKVALVSRKIEHLRPAAEAINQHGGEAIAVVADVRKPEEVERLLQKQFLSLARLMSLLTEPLATSCVALRTCRQTALQRLSTSI